MISDMIRIDNKGAGFENAANETRKAAQFVGLNRKETLRLQLLAEEMLCMSRIVTGEMQAAFWLECEDKQFTLHLTTRTVMDKEKRYLLISSSTSRKNEAANSFLGRLRDAFENAMASEVEHVYFDLPQELQADVSSRVDAGEEWDRYERSVLRKLADDVKIYIRGKEVHMAVTKKFA